MTIRVVVPHNEIVKAVIAHVARNSNVFQGDMPEDATVRIVDIGGSAYEAIIQFGEEL